MEQMRKKPLFNPNGDIDVRLRRMIGGNTTNLNDFNNMKYPWVSDWYRQAITVSPDAVLEFQFNDGHAEIHNWSYERHGHKCVPPESVRTD